MRIRLTLTLDLTRRGPAREADAPEPPHVDERSSGSYEVAPPVPIGFAIAPTNSQDPWEAADRS